MFIPEIRSEGHILYFTTNTPGYPVDQSIDLQVGDIKRTLQKGQTIYIHGTEGNGILVNTGNISAMKLLYEYSHEIPTWMKVEFDQFISEE